MSAYSLSMNEPAPAPQHFVSWQDFDAMVKLLARELNASGMNPDCIVGIARGGCVPAVALSHALGVPAFSAIVARIHESDAVRAQKCDVSIEASSTTFRGRRVLLVDDVLHTGATARACCEFILRSEPRELFFTALLRDTFDVKVAPSLPARMLTAKTVNAWVVFPWESAVDLTAQPYQSEGRDS